MLMYKEDGGFHNFPSHLVDTARADGWIDGQPKWDELMATKGVAKEGIPATMITQSAVKRPGRPRKVVPSILNDGDENEYSADDH